MNNVQPTEKCRCNPCHCNPCNCGTAKRCGDTCKGACGCGCAAKAAGTGATPR